MKEGVRREEERGELRRNVRKGKRIGDMEEKEKGREKRIGGKEIRDKGEQKEELVQ